MAEEKVLQYIGRFIDPHHASILVVQLHFAIYIELMSSVRAVMADRKALQRVFKGVRLYPGMGIYDYGYFKADSVRTSYQVKHFFYVNNVSRRCLKIVK